MVAEPARDQIPEWDGQANTLERFEEDVLIFTHAVPKERNRLGTSEVGCVATGGRRHSVAEALRLRLGKDLQQDVSEHYKRFLHRSARLYQQSVQHCIAEESNLHERA